MRGKIQRYFDHLKMGTIRTKSGIKYMFSKVDWTSDGVEPREGMEVAFQGEMDRAVQIKAEVIEVPASWKTVKTR
jgi:hypothetical protein